MNTAPTGGTSRASSGGGFFAFPFFFNTKAAPKPPAPNAKGGKKGGVTLGDVAAEGEGGKWEIIYSSILKSE